MQSVPILNLTIRQSTYLIGKRIVDEHPDHYWNCWNGDPSRLAIRKAQYHYVPHRVTRVEDSTDRW